MVPPSEPAREDGKGGLEAALGGASSQFRRRLAAGAVVVVTLVVGISTAARLAPVRRREAEGAGRAAGEGRPRLDGLRHLLRRSARAAQLGGRGPVGRQHRPGGDEGLLHAARERQGEDVHRRDRLDRSPGRQQDLDAIHRSGAPVSVADRSYFKAVVSTGAPFVSEGLVTRNANRRVVIMAVPTRDSAGRLTGVLDRSARASRVADRPAVDRPGLRGPHHPRPRAAPGDARELRAAQERRHPSPHQERRGRAHRCPRPRRLERARRRLRQLQGAGLDDGDRSTRLRPSSRLPARVSSSSSWSSAPRPWPCCASSAGLCCAHDGSRRPSGSRSGSGTSSLSRSATRPPRARSRTRSELRCRPRSRRRG